MCMKATAIPLTSKSFYTVAQAKQNKKALTSLTNRFGNEMAAAARNSNIPLWLLQGLVLVENLPGNATIVNSYNAVGLGQLVPAGAHDVVRLEAKAGKLTPSERAILRTICPAVDTAHKWKDSSKELKITTKMLQNSAFNLQVAAIYLSSLVDLATFENQVRYDLIIIGYNTSYFNLKAKAEKWASLTTDALITSGIPKESQNYITKFVGRNGHAQMILS
jgi:hypothetical protein